MSVTPHLLSNFGTSDLTPENALQSFAIDKQDPGVGYGVFQSHGGTETWIVKYNYDVSNTDAKQNHITPVSNYRITGSVDKKYKAGHSGSLQVYHRNGKTYLIVATKMTSVKGSTNKFATQLTRIPVEDFGNNNAFVNYDTLKRIGSLQNVGGKASALVDLDRVEFAIDYDESKIAVWVLNVATESIMALYNLDDIDALFNKANPEITIKGTKYGPVSDFTATKKKKIFPVTKASQHCSLQGFALTSAGSVYVGCEEGIGDPSDKTGKSAKGIWKFKVGANADAVGDPTRVLNGAWSDFTNKDAGDADGVGVEMENIQIISSELYLSATYHDTVDQVAHMQKNRLYHFDKTLI
ncbi:class III bacteriocin [Levilactobacillus humaensis]|uniref:class III bacteriocin n=1 Tax=Levilactobacillus humaensis TaxID=2950375 RepID=UPI0021C2C961|nr:class III bacteriocin [Levilactobacillus humaensis]